MIKKVLKVRRYKIGYEVREELHDGSEYGCDDTIIKTAYTTSGDYIGDPRRAYWLCKKRGIKPEKIDNTRKVCSIGFCEKDQKWFGWSHRAMFGFGIGSKIKKGDCGFKPKNILELYASLSEDERSRVVDADVNGLTIEYITYDTVPVNLNEPEGELECVNPKKNYYIINVGRGEWEAKTLDDARIMAVEFAKSVS